MSQLRNTQQCEATRFVYFVFRIASLFVCLFCLCMFLCVCMFDIYQSCCWGQALAVDALADKRLYEQELARMRKENAFLEDQVSLAERALRCACVLLDKAPFILFMFVRKGLPTIHTSISRPLRQQHFLPDLLWYHQLRCSTQVLVVVL